MSKNSTVYYSIHQLEEEREEECLVNLDDIMSIDASSYQEVDKLLDACCFKVSNAMIQDLLAYSRSFSHLH